ncbi:MAG: hypothetical protein FH756_01515 [Firmicutes bacterium]|nr:hypothetical protein [Bacillota bacterium]
MPAKISVSFFKPQDFINENVISEAKSNYHRGSANLTADSSQLVNRLLVKGGKQLSEPYDQPITVGTEPIPLDYKPRAPDGESVTVVIDGQQKTVGIQHVTDQGIKDFLLNVQEKLLVPDLCTTSTGTITYRYEYPIKFVLEDAQSQEDFGQFDDILKVDYDDYNLVLDSGLRHLAKYSRPVTKGTIEPFKGTYRPGQLVKVEIPSLKINEYLKIKEAAYESIPGQARVERKLTLESPARELPKILKDLDKRLAKLEKEVYQDDEGPVIKYIAPSELWGWAEGYKHVKPTEFYGWMNWNESAERKQPVEVPEETTWIEAPEEIIHACPVPSDNLYPGDSLIPC